MLGLSAGRHELMFKADKFNSDGYWERVDVVEWHDQALRRQRGWASAPPTPMAYHDDRLDGLAAEIPDLLAPYGRPWMLKDPRQCLYLKLWHEARGTNDLHIISVRHPHEIQRSLRSRNGYSNLLGLALWERYMYDMLRAARGHRALVVSYETLTNEPLKTVTMIAETLANTLLVDDPPTSDAVQSAVELIRPGRRPEVPEALNEQRQHLFDALMDQIGFNERLEFGAIGLSGESRQVIARRRRLLNVVGFADRANAVVKGRLDRRPQLR